MARTEERGIHAVPFPGTGDLQGVATALFDLKRQAKPLCRYFATQRSNKSGSFVRLEKLRESAKRPSTVLQALQDKYEREQTEAGTSLNLTSRVRVELVGMAKLRQQRGGIERLQEVSLQDVAISSAVSCFPIWHCTQYTVPYAD